MGARQSTSQSQPPTQGLHVLRVNAILSRFLLEHRTFFDFIVGFEGDSPSTDKSIDVSELEKIVESHEDKTLNLVVWNSKKRKTRCMFYSVLAS